MERLVSWWANNAIAANLLMFGILLAGVLGFNAMEREVFPTFKPAQVQVEVIWPGAAPQEVEEQIIVRIEEALGGLDNVYRIYSSAQEGYGQLDISTFTNVDIDEFLSEVKGVVDAVNSLPRDMENPRVKRTIYRQEVFRVAVHGTDLDERTLKNLAEDIRDEIAALPWVSIVDLFGTRRDEVTVEISENSLRKYNMSFSEVADAIRNSSINLSTGRIRTETGDVLLRARNMANTEDEFGSIVIRQTDEGAIIRVSDVANVIDGFEDEEILATMNGEPAVLVQVMSTDNMQIVKLSDTVREWMAERQKTLPDGVNLSIWFDQADSYKSRMDTITSSAIVGLLLVFLVLFLSLRPKVALWVTGGIAVAFMGTFAMLPASDVSLNILSTFAFLLVLGIVVDDAIVVGESIYDHSHKYDGVEAAVKGTMAVSKPVIFAVLTTMVAFAPWFFLSGEDAQVTRQLSIVITAALTISLIEAFLILPAHLRHLKHREKLGRFAQWQKNIEQSIVGFARNTYRNWVVMAVAHRYITTSLFFAFFVISVGVFQHGWVKFNFMPEVENELIYLQVTLPTGTPYSRALEILDQLQTAELALIDEVEDRAKAEGGTGKLIEGWYTRSRRDSVIAIVKLSPPEVRDMSAKEAAERLRDLVGDVPDADEIEINYTMNNSTPRVSFVIKHRDMALLQAAANDLKAKLHEYEGTFYVRDNMRGETFELHMQLLPGAEQLGLDLGIVSEQVRQAYYGEEVQRLPRENGDVKVMVRYPKSSRYSMESLNSFMIRTSDGREIPLMSVVDVELVAGVQRIQRRDGERMVQVTADVTDDLMSDINDDVVDNFLPTLEERYPGIVIGHSGQALAEELFLQELMSLYLVALFIMYALIAIAFRSYFLPLLVMTAIPFAFMGAVYGHLAFGVSMALFSFFGVGAAAGVVVNDNLVLVDFIEKLRKEGMSASEAVIESAVARFRPILLTTVTTFVGLMPIMMERSTDAQFLQPAVLSLAFGVLFALFVTLMLVPAMYCVGEDIRRGIAALSVIVKRMLGIDKNIASQS
ncbi:MAG: multidrug efflux pump subunit AcrB [Candidatus Azotimanducaceae bacterium]|jgi:multidrug efflux pump subunit AcrB